MIHVLKSILSNNMLLAPHTMPWVIRFTGPQLKHLCKSFSGFVRFVTKVGTDTWKLGQD